MGDALDNLKTDKAVLEALRKAPAVQPTSAEAFEQKVSFVYGSLKPENGVTRDKVRQILLEQGVAQS